MNKMKVHRSFITSQADAYHEKFVNALQGLRDETGIARELLFLDLSESIKMANLLQDNYGEYLTGQAAVKVKHITDRSIQQWMAFLKIDNSKNNLIKAY